MKVYASGLARIMACPGSTQFKNLPNTTSEDVKEKGKEGTACGEYLEALLLKKPLPTQATNGVYIDDDMKFYCKQIAESIFETAGDSEILCEQKVNWSTASGVRYLSRYDISFIVGDTLYIDDLKYGYGIVEAKDNWQLICYAIGEVIRRGKSFERIVLRIHQPRPHHEDGPLRAWTISYEQLLSYKEQIEKRLDGILNSSDIKLNTSSSCKYCPAAAEACPAFSRIFYDALEITYDFVQDSITEKELSKQMLQAERAAEVIKIKISSLTDLAIYRIKQGKIIKGYSVKESYSNRAWKGGVGAKTIEIMTGKKVTTQVMLSPAKVEKLGVDKKLVASLTERRFAGMKLNKKDSTEIGNAIFGTKPIGEK